MDFVYLLESASYDELVGSLMTDIVNEHYHKARTLQRALSLLTEKEKEGLYDCDCYIEEDALVFNCLTKSKNVETIISTVNSYGCEEFLITATSIEREITIVIKQNFDGREDEVLYGD